MDRKTIQRELAKLAVYYPQAKRTVDEISMLTDMWEEDIGHLDPERLKECIRLHRQRSVFFPVCADILEINIELNTRAYDSRPLLLDMDLTPEQIEENKAGLKALKKRFKIKGVSDEHENI